tara:strand:- start:97 stop:333 length:237 start_codon:yes stop_codon:yes gene_type:complete
MYHRGGSRAEISCPTIALQQERPNQMDVNQASQANGPTAAATNLLDEFAKYFHSIAGNFKFVAYYDGLKPITELVSPE